MIGCPASRTVDGQKSDKVVVVTELPFLAFGGNVFGVEGERLPQAPDRPRKQDLRAITGGDADTVLILGAARQFLEGEAAWGLRRLRRTGEAKNPGGQTSRRQRRRPGAAKNGAARHPFFANIGDRGLGRWVAGNLVGVSIELFHLRLLIVFRACSRDE